MKPPQLTECMPSLQKWVKSQADGWAKIRELATIHGAKMTNPATRAQCSHLSKTGILLFGIHAAAIDCQKAQLVSDVGSAVHPVAAVRLYVDQENFHLDAARILKRLEDFLPK